MAKSIDVALDKINLPETPDRDSLADEKLGELAESIREHSLLQPVVLTPADEGRYNLVAGNRRIAAFKLLGKKTIPARVMDIPEARIPMARLVENIQREDLNPLEEARAIYRAMEQARLTHEEIAEEIGKSRSWVSNRLRLLDMSTEVQAALSQGEITPSVAIELHRVKNPMQQAYLLGTVMQYGASVETTRAYVDNYLRAEKSTGMIPPGEYAQAVAASEQVVMIPCQWCGERVPASIITNILICQDCQNQLAQIKQALIEQARAEAKGE